MQPVVLLLMLSIITLKTAPVHSQSLRASRNPTPIGSDVTLSVPDSVAMGAWMFNNSLIVMFFPGNITIFDERKDRIMVNFTENHTSLTIKSLRLNDSGEYTQQGNKGKFSIKLSVQEPISNVTVTAQATDLVEFNDSAVFTCSVSSGTFLSYAWLNGSNSVISGGDRVQISDGGANLTVRVTRYDLGPFSCNVSNGISQEVSSSVHLKISYGPSNATMTLQPAENTYRTGANITLSCSADSSPAARIWWRVNGMEVNTTGSHLQLQNVTESDSGDYTCMFHNNVTARFTSTSKMIKVLAPVTEASVQINGSQPVLNHTFTLICQTSGVVESIAWMHNGSLLYSDNRRMLSVDNATLTFNPVVMSDSGNYSCTASNAISNLTSERLLLDIFYGPEVPWIRGPEMVKMGDNVTLICHAPSNPPSSYKWIFNGSVVADTSTYVTPSFTPEMNGMYTCVAHNNITGKNSTAHKMILAIYPITDVQIEPPMEAAIQGQLYNLTCHVTGPADHVYWNKNGQQLQADNQTIFWADNKTIMFNPLQKNHTGLYHCVAMNLVSTMASPSYLLLVNFGPEAAVITGPDSAEVGTRALLNCSADSYPPSGFTWWFNGSEVGNMSTFRTASLSFNMSGEYTCVASNNVTGGNSSATKTLTVNKATKVVITNNSVPINLKNFSLTCEVNGSYNQMYWLKDGKRLNANTSSNATDQEMSYHVRNNTLHFTPVSLHNDGEYKCVAINDAGKHQSPPFVLLVNYGPLSLHISGPDSAHLGTWVTLVCSASSRPACDFIWHVETPGLSLISGPKVAFFATKMHEGNYTCVAKNPVTNISLHQSKEFVVDQGAMLQAPSYGALLSLSMFAFSFTALFNQGGR